MLFESSPHGRVCVVANAYSPRPTRRCSLQRMSLQVCHLWFFWSSMLLSDFGRSRTNDAQRKSDRLSQADSLCLRSMNPAATPINNRRPPPPHRHQQSCKRRRARMVLLRLVCFLINTNCVFRILKFALRCHKRSSYHIEYHGECRFRFGGDVCLVCDKNISSFSSSPLHRRRRFSNTFAVWQVCAE